ncbi:hypothetical protein BgAZ_303420 [Babesia gibsoni]|uniref:Trafficking protein particle complex subunit n=1 Tax=Babesia gibsoni TaxID=33632 RepID=A0AAD8LL57_BABGI|nr:hypothetical protein BgAZ_303420 [Babesia gibsoni]
MATVTHKVIYVAIIGQQNEPIVTRVFDGTDEAELELSAYAAMDVIQEKMVIQQYSNNSKSVSEPYLGFITPTLVGEEFYKVHAYAAATGFKIIAIFNEVDAPISGIKQLFERIHKLFSTTICNPLMPMKFNSPNFDKALNKIAEEFSTW